MIFIPSIPTWTRWSTSIKPKQQKNSHYRSVNLVSSTSAVEKTRYHWWFKRKYGPLYLVLFYNNDHWDIYLLNEIEEEEAKQRAEERQVQQPNPLPRQCGSACCRWGEWVLLSWTNSELIHFLIRNLLRKQLELIFRKFFRYSEFNLNISPPSPWSVQPVLGYRSWPVPVLYYFI